MKTLIPTLGLATALVFALSAGPIRAQDDTAAPPDANVSAPAPGDNSVSFQTFYDQLANQGTWVQTDQYGYVFQPTESDPNWAPYTYGHWVNTDAGMTWVSNDSFGWATDHYGRWTNLDGYGWVWVPGTTWAPAWVSWRQSDDYVGWAPLPPETAVGIDYDDPGISVGFGFHIGDDCDLAFGIGPAWYNFCPVAFFGGDDCWRHYANRGDNFTIINNTTNVTNINVTNNGGAGTFGRVRAGGPNLARLNGRTNTPIQRASLAAVSDPRAAGLHGNQLAAFAPKIDPATVKTARPSTVSGTLAKARVNRGTDISKPLMATRGLKPEGPTQTQIHAAALAQHSVPAQARIATASAQPSRPLRHSLTALQPNLGRAGTHANATVGGGLKPNATVGANTGAAVTHRTTRPSAESAFTGEAVNHPAATSNRNAESAYTGAPATRHTAAPSLAERSFTGEPATAVHHAPAYSANTTPAYHPRASAPAYHPSAPVYHPQAAAPVIHHSAPAYHPQASAPAYHPSAPAYHPQASAPAYHHSAPAYHPQASAPAYHPSAPAYHPQASASAYHHSAPAYHPQASAPAYHHSAPAYHPQASAPAYHPSAPAYHPQASFHPAAPAAHVGGGGGGHPSVGVHASAGNNGKQH